SQRRVTFHLPDGSQESCSDSGLGDHEPVGSGSLLTQPLPLVQAQDDFYEQASPDKRTEADGNSDPNSEYVAPTSFLGCYREWSSTSQSLVNCLAKDWYHLTLCFTILPTVAHCAA
ncbi:hypothetical protein ATANTOWER_001339, partial [Ataeniobius toweri]|nr:hypothetical protein [Ataeniobius toweri]